MVQILDVKPFIFVLRKASTSLKGAIRLQRGSLDTAEEAKRRIYVRGAV